MKKSKHNRPHILDDADHYALVAAIFASIAEQGLLTEKVATLGGFQAIKNKGLI